MLKEKGRLEKQIQELQAQIKELPEGRLTKGRNGGYRQWFQSFGGTRKYITKKKRKLVEELAIKKYISCLLEDLECEKNAIDFYLRHHKNDVGKAERLLTNKSEYRELLSPYFKPISQELQEWLQEPFEQNPQYNENLILKTVSGHLVRSKSEVIIDTLLYVNKIPFRYECELKLGRRNIYPDFTIKHPKTGEVYYWEHFGMMTDEEYIRKACAKIQMYALHGITPGVNLIMTFETPEHPLGAEDVMEIIEKYFGVETNQELVKLQFSEVYDS